MRFQTKRFDRADLRNGRSSHLDKQATWTG
jgi:hypothetical protein